MLIIVTINKPNGTVIDLSATERAYTPNIFTQYLSYTLDEWFIEE